LCAWRTLAFQIPTRTWRQKAALRLGVCGFSQGIALDFT
jgi:hypothetical protein